MGSVGQARAEAPPELAQVLSHFEQVIEKPCAAVWPVLIDQSQWLSGFGGYRQTEPASAYQVEFGKGAAAGRQRFERVLENDAPHRRVIAMYDPIIHATALVVQTLDPERGGVACRSGVQVFVSLPWPSGVANQPTIAELEAVTQKGTDSKIAEDQKALKKLVEAR
jgi:hypothetical protein